VIVEVAADTRKFLFRYSPICGKASDAVDAVRSTSPFFEGGVASDAQRV
jgi:hypothetical protein